MALQSSQGKGHPRRLYGVIALLLTAVLMLAACGGNADPTPTAVPALPTDVPVEPTVVPPAVEEEAATEEEVAAADEVTETEAVAEEVATEEPAEEAAEGEEVAAADEVTETEAVAEEVATEAPTEAPTEEAAEEATEEPTEEAASEEVAAASPATIESARRVTEILSDRNAVLATISPDGAQIAYYIQTGRLSNTVRQICTLTLANAALNCHDFPTDEFAGYPYQLQWSPDASTIAFSENPVELGNDSDIWTLNIAEGVFTNLTDDGVSGSWQNALVDTTDDIFLDYMPAWGPDGNIYFWRVVPVGVLTFDVAIYRVSPDGGDPEEVRNITDALPSHLLLFRTDSIFLDGFSAVSPDGTSLAALLTTINSMGGQERSLVVFDLEDADAEPQVLISGDQWRAGLPDWQTFPPAPLGLSWTGDSAGVVVFTFSNAVHTPFSVLYYGDVASGDVTPVVDFSAIEDATEYVTGETDAGLPMRAFSPWSASLAPSGDAVLLVNDLAGTTGVFWAPLPPTGDLPPVIGSQDTFTTSQASRASRASNGLVLVYQILFSVAE